MKRDHTLEGLISNLYSTMKQSSRSRGHLPPEFTKDELGYWLVRQVSFIELFSFWQRAGFKSEDKPSVDRLDNSMGYVISNIQLMTWDENNKKNWADMQGTQGKPVAQFYKGEIFVARFSSIAAASRETGIYYDSISACCNGRQLEAGGHTWKFE